MKSALLRPYPVRTSASAHPGKYRRATLAHSIVSDLLSRRRAAASRWRSARPIRVAVSQKASSVTGQPAPEKVGSGIEVAVGDGLETLGEGAYGPCLGVSADPHAITPTSSKDARTDHLICSHLRMGEPPGRLVTPSG